MSIIHLRINPVNYLLNLLMSRHEICLLIWRPAKCFIGGLIFVSPRPNKRQQVKTNTNNNNNNKMLTQKYYIVVISINGGTM